ncbi:MAG: bile acid:sodium symporter family protein [Acidimicrobiia bacterium]|nr:bile acid:sodium symporter family protein [Acidimicrobiia bacterium]
MAAALTNAFPLWVLLATVAALVEPSLFTWFTGPLITIGLGVAMLGMGLTLELADFTRVRTLGGLVGLGVLLQYTVMPLAGWSIAWLLDLPTPFAVGLILVSCCPGGTASNVISYLARADVPLSVTMTAASTLLAALATPTLTAVLAGSRVDVPAVGLFQSTLQVVVLPVVLGVSARRFAPRLAARVLPVAPLTAVVMITLIVASIMGEGRNEVLTAGGRLLAAVFLLHVAGFALGYAVSRPVSGQEIAARTISIEVGMQNSGLGVVLARQNFASPLVAIPCAISSVFHSLIGSVVAWYWRAPTRNPESRSSNPKPKPKPKPRSEVPT